MLRVGSYSLHLEEIHFPICAVSREQLRRREVVFVVSVAIL